MARVCQREGCGELVKRARDRFCGPECRRKEKKEHLAERRRRLRESKRRCPQCGHTPWRFRLRLRGALVELNDEAVARWLKEQCGAEPCRAARGAPQRRTDR